MGTVIFDQHATVISPFNVCQKSCNQNFLITSCSKIFLFPFHFFEVFLVVFFTAFLATGLRAALAIFLGAFLGAVFAPLAGAAFLVFLFLKKMSVWSLPEAAREVATSYYGVLIPYALGAPVPTRAPLRNSPVRSSTYLTGINF